MGVGDCGNCVHCVPATCACQPCWAGKYCDFDTKIGARQPLFIAYQCTVAICSVLLLILTTIRLYSVIRSSRVTKGLPRLKIFALLVFECGLVLRCVEYAIDPHAWRGIFNWYAQPVLFNLPIILYFIAYGINLNVWMEMQILYVNNQKSDLQIRFLTSQQRILPIAVIVFSVVSLGSVLLRAGGVISDAVGLSIYAAIFIIMLIYLVVTSNYFGGKIISHLRRQSTLSNRAAQGLRNMTKMVIYCSAVAVAIVIVMVVSFAGCQDPVVCASVPGIFMRTLEGMNVWLAVTAISNVANSTEEPNGNRLSSKPMSKGPKLSADRESATATATAKTDGVSEGV